MPIPTRFISRLITHDHSTCSIQIRRTAVACFIFACASLAAHAETIDALDSGFVTAAGGSSKGDGTVAPTAAFNYSVGREEHYDDGALGSPLAAMDRKNYFLFDLAGVSGTITGASLLLYVGPTDTPAFADDPFTTMHGYESMDATETFELLETTDPDGAKMLAGDLLTGLGSGPMAFDEPGDPLVGAAGSLYAKLGDGGPLATPPTTFSAADDGMTVSIPLSPAGLTYLNTFVGDVVILAGALPSAVPEEDVPPFIAGDTFIPQAVFGFTGPDLVGGDPLSPKLDITVVPEPSTVALSILGLLSLGLMAWLRRQS